MIRYVSYGTATAAAVAVAIVLWSPGRSPADDAKRAAGNAAAAKTVRVLVEQDDGAGGKITTRIYIAGQKRRTDIDPPGGRPRVTVIMDDDTFLMLVPTEKTYRRVELTGGDPVGPAKPGYGHASLCATFKTIRNDRLNLAADEYLDGRKTRVYEVLNVRGEGEIPVLDGADLKMWVDPKTDLPVKAQVVARIGDKTVTSVYTYLGFNEDLDPKLFDLTVPDGYKPMDAGPPKPADKK